MSNPWDVPPWPLRGDETANSTYVEVGRVITLWGFIETDLSVLYSHFIDRYDDLDAFAEYGGGTIFRKRFAAMKEAAARYFVRCPHQVHEATFDRLALLLDGFADRRNEVAHGVVSRVETSTWFKSRLAPEVRDRPNYMVLPPFFWATKRGPDGFPSFAYTSVELLELGERLFTICQHTRAYVAAMLPPALRDGLLQEALAPSPLK